MNTEQVAEALRKKFFEEGSRLVFWHDSNGEFSDYVDSGLAADLAQVELLDLREIGGLKAKLRLEREQPETKFLVYSEGERPAVEEDFLLDIRIYSSEFQAEIASLQLQELGLNRFSMREHLRERVRFLRNKTRFEKLKSLVDPDDDEAALDRKMMAVLSKSEMSQPFDILRAVCHGHAVEGDFDLSTEPSAMTEFGKMDLADGFWREMSIKFGYQVDDPTVAGLLRKVFISELLRQVGTGKLGRLTHHELPGHALSDAVAFLTQWRDSAKHAESYAAAARAIAKEQNVENDLESLDLEDLRRVYTFWEAEKRVVASLRDRVIDEPPSIDLDEVRELAAARKAEHWLTGVGAGDTERAAIAASYDAIVAAAELFELARIHGGSFAFEAPAELLASYQADLYRFDRLYREFFTSAKPATRQGWDLLKTLSEKVERTYDQKFLQPLGAEWSRLLDAGFLDRWTDPALPPQQKFYADCIEKHLEGSARKRAFVIISDAFRYEAATELKTSLNHRYRMNAELSGMLGVLPSYTALGMASLLPHKEISFSASGDVLADGKSTSGVAARSKQLEHVEGMACQADDLLTMTASDARQFTEGHRVVYIYHNVIDARGDARATEGETFEAVAECISGLGELVKFCMNKLNAAKVWVTADHGFLFQEKELTETDRSQLDSKPDQAVKHKKRYVIGPELGEAVSAHRGRVNHTSDALGEMEFWIPRAANRFHFTGGARFVHGGAMPQEVVIPLVTVTQLRNEQEVEASRSEKVSVQVLGMNHKITTPVHRFKIMQTEKAGERRAPLTLRAALYDGADIVSSVETVALDSSSDNIQDREKSIRLELESGSYDKAKPYHLILRDAETEAEVQSVPVVIDRSFDDDF